MNVLFKNIMDYGRYQIAKILEKIKTEFDESKAPKQSKNDQPCYIEMEINELLEYIKGNANSNFFSKFLKFKNEENLNVDNIFENLKEKSNLNKLPYQFLLSKLNRIEDLLFCDGFRDFLFNLKNKLKMKNHLPFSHFVYNIQYLDKVNLFNKILGKK